MVEFLGGCVVLFKCSVSNRMVDIATNLILNKTLILRMPIKYYTSHVEYVVADL